MGATVTTIPSAVSPSATTGAERSYAPNLTLNMDIKNTNTVTDERIANATVNALKLNLPIYQTLAGGM